MDVYISPDVHQILTALSLIHSHQPWEGVIIGHKRGHRYFIERVYPLPHLFSFLPQKFFQLDHTFKSKLIGFWGYNLSQQKIDKILAPFAFGKLFLQLDFDSSVQLDIRSFTVDYKEKFFLSPIQLKL